ncbi:carbohydrate sulfotransferase 3 isoform X2 [Zeugodacus cucurbitae]|uniref:Carbohydrate sulfotransferase 5 n=1 Tax=Zeugodacus cucurbitae TaxID=28588 RepID=A0A0A1XL14_ZEUCU|nr:carbohydrate sulfotransferase 3 isoform X2 [Zeugodacus cucurbitae]
MWKIQLFIYCGVCIWFVALFTIFPKNPNMKEALFKQRQIVNNEINSLRSANMSIVVGNKNTVRNVIVTRWLSGSSRLVKYFHRAPGYYQHFSPLYDSKHQIIRAVPEITDALKYLKQLLQCDYNKTDLLLKMARKHFTFYSLYGHQRKLCRKYPLHCWNKEFLSEVCKMYPFLTMIVYKMMLKDIGQMLNDKSLNVRMILLVRDPRGTMQSRKHRDWCAGNSDCENPHYVCQDLVADYHAAVELLKEHPSRFRTLRYEDLSLNTYDMTQEVLQFYGLPFDPLVEEFLDTHTKVNIGGVSSTYRDSKSAPFHWKQDLRPDEIQYIQKNCEEAMQLWGYRKIENFTNFQQATFDPIELPPPFS